MPEHNQTSSRVAEATKREYEAWRILCRLLQDGGAVTAADLERPTGERETFGQILLCSLREWGKAKQDLGGAREERPRNGVSQLSLV